MGDITVSTSGKFKQPIGHIDNNYNASSSKNTSSFKKNITTNTQAIEIEDLDLNNDLQQEPSFFEKVGSAVSGMAEGVADFFEDTAATIGNGVKTVCDGINSWFDDVGNWWNNEAAPFFNQVTKKFEQIITSTGATVVTFAQSLVEGVLNFGEAIVDLGALLGTAITTPVTLLVDGVSSLVTGKEFDASLTKTMWDDTKGFVSQKYVSTLFDSLYNDTKYGQWLKNNAYGFDTVRSVGSGIGYVAGVTALTIVTFGVGGAAVAGGGTAAAGASAATTATVSAGQLSLVAGAAGIGKGTQDAWADGANLVEGLGAGVLSGIWEGAQFYVGAKIGGTNIAGTEKTFNKILSGTARVILDGVDGGVEGFFQPLIASIYTDGYTNDKGEYVKFDKTDNFFERYGEIFDDYGSWKNVLTQAAVGAGASTLGEMLDVSKYFKNKNKTDLNINSIQDFAKKFDTYEDFVAAYKNSTESWRQTLTEKELRLIYNYIGESDYSSYATINSVMRGIAINKEAKTITLYHTGGKHVYTFDEYFKTFNETVDEFIIRTYDEANTLNNAIAKTTFKEDTVITRGVDRNALERFGITKSDSPEEIMKKLGPIYTDNGFMSSTPVAGGGFTDWKDVNFVMKCKKGMSFGEFSFFNPVEKEILLGLGSKFSIDSVKKVGNKIMIYMTSIN